MSALHNRITPIGACRLGHKVTVTGTISMVTVSAPHAPAGVEAHLYDDSGVIELHWMGRHTMPGIDTGRHIEVEGRIALHGRDLAIYNPRYKLLS